MAGKHKNIFSGEKSIIVSHNNQYVMVFSIDFSLSLGYTFLIFHLVSSLFYCDILIIMRPFTLLELLIVIAVIAILAGLLLPALNMAKQTAQRITCVAVLKQITLGTLEYADTSSEYLPNSGNRTQAIQYIACFMAGIERTKSLKGTPFYKKFCCPVKERYRGKDQIVTYPGYFGWKIGDCPGNPSRPEKLSSVKKPSETVLFIDGPSSWAGGQPWFGTRTAVTYWYYLPGAKGVDGSLPGFTGDESALNDYLKGRHSMLLNKSHWDGHVDPISTSEAILKAKILDRGWDPNPFWP